MENCRGQDSVVWSNPVPRFKGAPSPHICWWPSRIQLKRGVRWFRVPVRPETMR